MYGRVFGGRRSWEEWKEGRVMSGRNKEGCAPIGGRAGEATECVWESRIGGIGLRQVVVGSLPRIGRRPFLVCRRAFLCVLSLLCRRCACLPFYCRLRLASSLMCCRLRTKPFCGNWLLMPNEELEVGFSAALFFFFCLSGEQGLAITDRAGEIEAGQTVGL